MTRHWLLLLLGLSGCFPSQVGDCLGTAIGQALGNVGLARAREGGKNPARPDEAFPLTDAGTYVSVAHAGGRLGFEFSGVVSNREMPRRNEACALTDYVLFHPADGGVGHVLATITVAEQSLTDAGTRISFQATNLRLSFPDGGATPLGERQVDVIVR